MMKITLFSEYSTVYKGLKQKNFTAWQPLHSIPSNLLKPLKKLVYQNLKPRLFLQLYKSRMRLRISRQRPICGNTSQL